MLLPYYDKGKLDLHQHVGSAVYLWLWNWKGWEKIYWPRNRAKELHSAGTVQDEPSLSWALFLYPGRALFFDPNREEG